MQAGGVLGEEGGAELAGDLDADLTDRLGLVVDRLRRSSSGAGMTLPFMPAMRRTPATVATGMTPGSTGLSTPSSPSSSTRRR